MNDKVSTSQKQSEQLQNKDLRSDSEGRFNDLVKNRSWRGNVATWAAVAASVVGISVSIAMPAESIHRVTNPYERCQGDNFFDIFQGQRGDPTMCFADAGDMKVVIADVHMIFSGNNAGYIETNKGNFDFKKEERVDFIDKDIGTVTILRIVIR